jgi:hypothetical protein
MPQPTKEQFEAAAKKVMASAPPGLSREQFFALIDKELAGGSYTPTNLLDRSKLNTQEMPPAEPDTWWGGFAKGLKDYYGPKIQRAEDALGHLAQPTDTSDFTALLMPTGVPAVVKDAVGGFKIFGRAGQNAMREAKDIGAARGTSSIREFPKQAIKALSEEWNRPELKGPRRADLLSSLDRVENPPQVTEPWAPEAADPEAWRKTAAQPDVPLNPEPSSFDQWLPNKSAGPQPAATVPSPPIVDESPWPSVDPFHPNVSAGPQPASTVPSPPMVSESPWPQADPHLPNVSAGPQPRGSVPSPPIEEANPWPQADPFHPNMSAGPQPAGPSLPGDASSWPDVDRYFPNKSSFGGEVDLQDRSSLATGTTTAPPPADAKVLDLPDAEIGSTWPPEGGQGDWHSGVPPSSIDAARARGLHRDTGLLDSRLKSLFNDEIAPQRQDIADFLMQMFGKNMKPPE